MPRKEFEGSSVEVCSERLSLPRNVAPAHEFPYTVTIPLVTITLVRTTSFSIYTWSKDELLRKGWLTGETVPSTAAAGFLGGAASGLLLSVGTTAFEYTKIKLQLEYLIA
jgi:hypothetical protein